MLTVVEVTQLVQDRAAQFGAHNPQQTNYMSKRFAKLPDDIIIAGLVAVIAQAPDTQVGFDQQRLAGLLLWHGKHRCHLELKDILDQIIDSWDLSVYELPYYLCRECGINAVQTALQHMSIELYQPNQQRRLSTLEYWVRRYAKEYS